MPHQKTGTPRKKATKKKRRAKPVSIKHHSAALPPIIDPRTAEKSLFAMGKLMEKQNFASADEANTFLQQFIEASDFPVVPEELTPVEQAQEKMYEAWNAKGKKQRVCREIHFQHKIEP